MGKWCLHASSFIFDRMIIKVAGKQDRHKSSDELDFGPLVPWPIYMLFEMRFDLGLSWAIVALWTTCLFIFDLLSILFRIAFWPSAGKELSSWLSTRAVFLLFCDVVIVRVPFPFGVWGGMWSSIVSFPDYCLFIYFSNSREPSSSVTQVRPITFSLNSSLMNECWWMDHTWVTEDGEPFDAL